MPGRSPRADPAPVRIGYLAAGPDAPSPLVDAFRRGLRDFGYVEGENILVEYRFAGFEPRRYSALIEDLVSLGVAMIVAGDSVATPVARTRTTDIPIVMVMNGDPVGEGLIDSLERPGGNVTGLTTLARALTQQRLALLQAAVPGAARVAVLWNSEHAGADLVWNEARAVVEWMGLGVLAAPVRAAEELPGAFDAAVAGGADAVLALTDRLVTFHRKQVVGLATDRRLPGMYG
jgi:putative tryptophan/tyrosine transport system substrate-binding protein